MCMQIVSADRTSTMTEWMDEKKSDWHRKRREKRIG